MLKKEKEAEILALIRRCRRYERGAQFELYHKFYGFGMAICMRYVHSQEDALEMLNDAFYHIFTKMNEYNEQYTFVTWARTIFVRLSIDHLRKYKLQLSVDEWQETSTPDIPEAMVEWMNYEELVLLINRLPPQYRAVFNLYEVEGYPHEEIAQLLGINIGTSKSNLFRARERLKQIAHEYFNDGALKNREP